MFTKSIIATVAFAFLSASSVVARVNHADLYGYPHNRGAPPAGVPRQKITPGGYRDPRPANQGAACRANNQCSTDIVNARAVCGADGACTFSCLGQTTFDGTSCTGQIVSPRCSFDRQCPTQVANASGVCVRAGVRSLVQGTFSHKEVPASLPLPSVLVASALRLLVATVSAKTTHAYPDARVTLDSVNFATPITPSANAST